MIAESWSYPNDLVTEVITETNDAGRQGSNGSSGVENERFVDLSKGPPVYEENGPSHIAKIKEELGLHVKEVCIRMILIWRCRNGYDIMVGEVY